MMDDVKTPNDVADIEDVLEKKCGTIEREFQEALKNYRALVRQSVSEGDNLNPETELALMQSVAYIGLLCSGLATLFRQETSTHVDFLKADGHPESTLVSKAAEMRVKALKFVEHLVRETQTEVAKKLGLALPPLEDIRDAQTGKPLSVAAAGTPKKRSDLN